MTMKLPVILSAMIAALAIPGSIASEADAKGTDAVAETAAAPEGGAAAEAATPVAEEKKATGKKKRKHHGGMHHKGKKRRYADGSGGHVADVWDLPYDYAVKQRADDSSGCSGDSADHGKQLPTETPGQTGPNVPRGM